MRYDVFLGTVPGGLVCSNGKSPTYTAEQYAALKKNASKSLEDSELFEKQEKFQRKLAGITSSRSHCKSGKCEFDEKIGQGLCVGNEKILFENGKGCSMGESAKTLSAGQNPDPIPEGGTKGVQDSMGKNCKSGKCYWNKKIGQAICGSDADESATTNPGSVIKESHGFIASAMFIAVGFSN
jgi:hypothetical protein